MTISISLSENKFEDVKKVQPDFTLNRFDVLFGNNFNVLKIDEDSKIFYAPFHISFFTCRLGIALAEISQEALECIVKFIFNKYKFVFQIKIQSCLHKYAENSYEASDYWINLPETEEAYKASLSSNTRYNLQRRIKQLKKEIGDYKITKYTNSNVPSRIIKDYFKFKKMTLGKSYLLSPEAYLKKYAVTSVYILSISDKTEAAVLISETGDNAYLENVTYNPELSKYSIGVTLLYHMIIDLIGQHKKQLFLGASRKDDYKRRLSNKSIISYSMKINKY